MAFRLGANTNNNIRAAATNAMVSCVNGGTGNPSGQILIYTGTQPATPDTSPSGTLLVTISFANPAYATANASGAADLAGGTAISATVATSGTAGWFRVIDRAGDDLFDGSCGLSSSGADMIFDNVNFVAGGTCTITSLAITTPM
jgi:hypothetical protein